MRLYKRMRDQEHVCSGKAEGNGLNSRKQSDLEKMNAALSGTLQIVWKKKL
jgi:hypothetical protein